MYLLDRRHFLATAGAASAVFPALSWLPAQAAAGAASVFTADAYGGLVDSTIVLGEKKALVIDAQFTVPNATRLADTIAATGRTLETIYITHFHPDHHLGLAVLMDRFPDAKPVAHKSVQPMIKGAAQAMLDQMRAGQPDAFASRVVIPDVLGGDTLDLEGEKLEVIGPMHGDTPVGTAVFIPSLSTLVAADLVYHDTHVWLAENTNPDDLAKWRTSLDTLEKIGAATVVPGHRQETTKNDSSGFAFMRSYLDHWEAALAEAKDAASLKAAMIEKVGNLPGEFFLDRAVAAARA